MTNSVQGTQAEKLKLSVELRQLAHDQRREAQIIQGVMNRFQKSLHEKYNNSKNEMEKQILREVEQLFIKYFR